MFEAIKKVAEYCNTAWRGKFSAREIDEFTTQLIECISVSSESYIDEVVLDLLCGLSEDAINGSEDAQNYYDAIMNYIIA